MKIKVLKIRNIASIEHGDIDFENGLTDPVSGDPAPLFLIDGDTGAGKSVILDCISMALYATTPRIENASGKKNNSFDDKAGNNIKISDITQYTRLGISAKDECCAELSFEGNDGRAYQARFELGVTRNGTYRKPVWTLLLEDGTLLSKNGDIKEAVARAVGLTFEQFSRMAMLAQGQFATFLTGGKEERERILEQLTNTELFSIYGEAIKKIFGRKKQSYEEISAEYDRECARLMTDDEVKEASLELERVSMEEKKLKAKSEMLSGCLADLNLLIRTKDELEATVKKLDILRGKEKSSEFADLDALVKRWDSTVTEREKLALRQRSAAQLKNARADMEAARERYRTLCADIAFREERMDERRREFSVLSEWLDSRSGKVSILCQASGIVENLKMLSVMLKDLVDAEREEAADRNRLPVLEKSRVEAAKKAGESTEKLRLHQEAIETASRDRDALHPDSILKEISACHERARELTELGRLISELGKDRNEEARISEEIGALEGNVARMRLEASAAAGKYAEIRTALENARSRHLTMHRSVEDGLRSLRRKMVEEHTEVCPLCGSHIESLTLDEDEFNDILDPLKKEVDALERSLSESEKNLDFRKSALDMEVGTLKEKRNGHEALRKKIAEAVETISRRAGKTGIPLSDDVSPALEEAFSANREETERLETLHAEAEKINKRISELLSERKSLEKLKTDDDKRFEKARDAYDKCRQKLLLAGEHMEAIRKKKNALSSSIERLIGSGYPLREEDLGETIACIQKDAEEYNANLAKRDSEKNGINNAEKELSDIRETMRDVARYGGFPQEPVKAADAGVHEARSEWSGLLADVRTSASLAESATKDIMDSDRILTKYYSEHSTDEASLRQLMDSSASVAEARAEITSLRGEIKSLEDAADRLKERIVSLMSAIKSEKEEDMPSRESLAEEKGKVDSEHAALIERTALLKAKLKENEGCRKETKELERKMMTSRKDFEIWDKMYRYFGGTRFRTLVQSHILRPLLNNANLYLERITDHYRLTCSDSNEQLSILVHDRYNKDSLRSVTVLSGGERFMISLALSLALSSMNKADMNIDILFIDEGFGTLDVASLNAVMSTLRRLPEIAGQNGRRVGIISHREELAEEIDVRINVRKKGEGRSFIRIER